ncbi:hypothetical protein [Rahnella bonaserana]
MKILPASISLAEYKRSVYIVQAKHGQTFEEFKDPEAWAHVSPNFKKFDKVELIAEDGSFYAEGLVIKITRTTAVIHFYLHCELNEKAESTEDAAYYAAFAGKAKWRVIRRSDSEVVESHIESKDEALALVDKLISEGE